MSLVSRSSSQSRFRLCPHCFRSICFNAEKLMGDDGIFTHMRRLNGPLYVSSFDMSNAQMRGNWLEIRYAFITWFNNIFVGQKMLNPKTCFRHIRSPFNAPVKKYVPFYFQNKLNLLAPRVNTKKSIPFTQSMQENEKSKQNAPRGECLELTKPLLCFLVSTLNVNKRNKRIGTAYML